MASRCGQWARSHGVTPYEVSVLNRDCIKEAFAYAAWRMGNPGNECTVLSVVNFELEVMAVFLNKINKNKNK